MIIRNMTQNDTDAVIEMMKVFYASPAVLTNGSEDIFQNDVQSCIGDNPYLEGYLFAEDGNTAGYSMISKGFSTECGKSCIWIEDLYIKPEYRGKGFGTEFFSFIEQKYPDSVIKLEVEQENQGAIHVYTNCGYEVLPYMILKKNLTD